MEYKRLKGLYDLGIISLGELVGKEKLMEDYDEDIPYTNSSGCNSFDIEYSIDELAMINTTTTSTDLEKFNQDNLDLTKQELEKVGNLDAYFHKNHGYFNFNKPVGGDNSMRLNPNLGNEENADLPSTFNWDQEYYRLVERNLNLNRYFKYSDDCGISTKIIELIGFDKTRDELIVRFAGQSNEWKMGLSLLMDILINKDGVFKKTIY